MGPKQIKQLQSNNKQLEDLKVLRRSPDLFYHVKIGQCQLQGILIKHKFLLPYMGVAVIWSSYLKLHQTPQ